MLFYSLEISNDMEKSCATSIAEFFSNASVALQLFLRFACWRGPEHGVLGMLYYLSRCIFYQNLLAGGDQNMECWACYTIYQASSRGVFALWHGISIFRKFAQVHLQLPVQEFADEVSQEGDIVLHGSIKAPKVLANIVESLAAAIYFDLNFDLQKLRVIFRDLLKPIVTLEVLQQQPHPIDTLYKQCAKQGREVAIKPWRDWAKNIASVYVDGVFVASGSSNQLMDIARLNAAKQALLELAKSMPTNIGRLDFSFGLNKSLEIEGAKQKLQEFCKKRWAIPSYSIVKAEGPPHAKKYVCLVQIENADGTVDCLWREKKSQK
nr:ribonuclease 3-like protein 2 [Quercus suber]